MSSSSFPCAVCQEPTSRSYDTKTKEWAWLCVACAEKAAKQVRADTPEAWHEVISIFGSYLDPGQTLPVTGGHNKVWIGVDPEKVSDKHKARLEALGWAADDEGHNAFSSYQNA